MVGKDEKNLVERWIAENKELVLPRQNSKRSKMETLAVYAAGNKFVLVSRIFSI